ncbi:MAG: pyrroline-5-carboxylate reductase [Candidatus Omnitrophota bacterium]|nr:pyrroline-5-carboxylate reductase [Candidatus Omnitrophota bacterium]
MIPLKQKIGLIGAGNMGTAICEALLKKGLLEPDQLWVYDKIADKSKDFAVHRRANAVETCREVAANADVILLAIKPQDLESAAADLKGELRDSHHVISILAGTRLDRLREVFGDGPQFVRAMPNLGAKVGEAVTALAGDSLDIAEPIFRACGKTVRLDENHFDLVTALSGSGPAYFFLLMECLSKVGQDHGLAADVADLLAIQTAVGAGLVAQSAVEGPAELRKRVTSKGGTTEAALKVLQAHGFDKAFSAAIEAAINRGRELSQNA